VNFAKASKELPRRCELQLVAMVLVINDQPKA